MNVRKILIGGRFVSGNGIWPVLSPYSQESVSDVYVASVEQASEAMDLALDAGEDLKNLSPAELADGLKRISGGIEKRKREFAETITKESGKPLYYSEIEVERAVATFAFAGAEAVRFSEFRIPIDTAQAGDGRLAEAYYFPKGLVFGITPFNFPLNLVAHKVAPALAARNPVIIKPSEKTPLTALLLGEIFLESGLPASSLQVFPMEVRDLEPVLSDSRVAMISFTGSDRVGWDLKKRYHRKSMALELGGNAPVIVDETADPQKAGEAIAGGAFSFSGQVCISVQRIIVEKGIEPALTSVIKETASRLQKGDPLDRDTRISVMISKQAADNAIELIRAAVEEGAVLVCGGKAEGAFIEPTLVRNPKRGAAVVNKEIFAPVATVETFDEFDEAVRLANSSRFGLQAGVFTNDRTRAKQAVKQLEYGGVLINEVPTFRLDNMPYGGIKDSGYGREGVRFAMEEMSDLKTVIEK